MTPEKRQAPDLLRKGHGFLMYRLRHLKFKTNHLGTKAFMAF
jgi:hypothetical protein